MLTAKAMILRCPCREGFLPETSVHHPSPNLPPCPSDPHLALDDPGQAATRHRTKKKKRHTHTQRHRTKRRSSEIPQHHTSHSSSSNLCLQVTFLEYALCNTWTQGTLIPLTRNNLRTYQIIYLSTVLHLSFPR